MAEPFAASRPLALLLCASLIWLSPVCAAPPSAEPAIANDSPSAVPAPDAEPAAPATQARQPLIFRPTRLQLCQRELGESASSRELTTCLSRRMRAEHQAELKCQREANQIKGNSPQQTAQLRKSKLSQCLDTALLQPLAKLQVAPSPMRPPAAAPRPAVTAADATNPPPRPSGVTATNAKPADEHAHARPVPASSSKHQSNPSGQVATAATPPPSKRAVSNEAAAPRPPSRAPSVSTSGTPLPTQPEASRADSRAKLPAKAQLRKAPAESAEANKSNTEKPQERGDAERAQTTRTRAAPANSPQPEQGQTDRATETTELKRPSKRAVTTSAAPRSEEVRAKPTKAATSRQPAAKDAGSKAAPSARTNAPRSKTAVD